MAGRTADITTSSFKPLDLNEIMMVPLARQKQEDEVQLAIDEFSLLESQALDADKEYVTGQLDALRNEASGLSDQLMNSGVDRNLVNKLRTLRNRKNKELSLSGKTGQSAAAYNEFKANEQEILRRNDLSADQKRLGLLEAKRLYEEAGGAQAGAQYQHYQGVSKVDLAKRAIEVANQITPEETARALGIKLDKDGYYYMDGYKTKTLSREDIERAVYQTMRDDQNVSSYANEMERLGIVNSADDEIRNAAINAGNLKQRNDYSETKSLAPAWLNNPKVQVMDSRKGTPVNNWESRYDIGTEAAFNHTLDIPENPEEYKTYFKPNGDFTDQKQETEALGMELEPIIQPTPDEIDAAKKLIAEDDIVIAELKKINKDKLFNRKNQSWDDKKARFDAEAVLKRNKRYLDRVPNSEAKNLVKKVRENNAVFEGTKPDYYNAQRELVSGEKYSDRDVYEAYMGAKKRSAATASQRISPKNPSSTFYASSERLMGSDGNVPGIVSKNIPLKLADGKEGGYQVMMEHLGYGDDTDAFMADLKLGDAPSYAPGVPGMPGARFVSFRNSKDGNKMVQMFVEPTIEESKAFKNVGAINDLIYSGENFKKIEGLSNGANQFAITELDPRTMRYEGATILTQPGVVLTKEDIPYINYVPVPDRPGVFEGIVNTGPNEGQVVFKTTLDAEMQQGQEKINRYWDSTRDAKTSAKEAASLKGQN